MTQEHPITPPPELVRQWAEQMTTPNVGSTTLNFDGLVAQAARWGADQEVGACCQWLSLQGYDLVAAKFRAARRPKPPSLKEQALELVDRIEKAESVWAMSELDTIRRALESLPD